MCRRFSGASGKKKKRGKVCCKQNSVSRTFSGRSGVLVEYRHNGQNDSIPAFDAGHLNSKSWLDFGLFFWLNTLILVRFLELFFFFGNGTVAFGKLWFYSSFASVYDIRSKILGSHGGENNAF